MSLATMQMEWDSDSLNFYLSLHIVVLSLEEAWEQIIILESYFFHFSMTLFSWSSRMPTTISLHESNYTIEAHCYSYTTLLQIVILSPYCYTLLSLEEAWEQIIILQSICVQILAKLNGDSFESFYPPYCIRTHKLDFAIEVLLVS